MLTIFNLPADEPGVADTDSFLGDFLLDTDTAIKIKYNTFSTGP